MAGTQPGAAGHPPR